MQIYATLLVAASVVLGQQIGSDGGPAVSNGENAISNPNVNNGWQSQNSLFNTGDSGSNVFSGLKDNTFNSAVSNSATNDNNFVNPSQSHVTGNNGATTNGEANHIGDVFTGGHGFAPVGVAGFGGFFKRDAVFNNGFVHDGFAHPVVAAGYPYEHVAVHPGFAHPGFGYPAGFAHPGFGGHVNHNFQDASIVQNQF
ncbi:hypothetical protein GGI07_002607 [Coemansia sp. Benny D115]|nr:hypothetical protein GGI07_002607 [Coemansia sp. Benny D115]